MIHRNDTIMISRKECGTGEKIPKTGHIVMGVIVDMQVEKLVLLVGPPRTETASIRKMISTEFLPTTNKMPTSKTSRTY